MFAVQLKYTQEKVYDWCYCCNGKKKLNILLKKMENVKSYTDSGKKVYQGKIKQINLE